MKSFTKDCVMAGMIFFFLSLNTVVFLSGCGPTQVVDDAKVLGSVKKKIMFTDDSGADSVLGVYSEIMIYKGNKSDGWYIVEVDGIRMLVIIDGNGASIEKINL